MLVLGGYGTAGAMLARLLLEQSDAEVVVAGRTAAKADAFAAELAVAFGPRRCSARCVDAASPRALDDALTGIDIVVVASSTLAYVRTVAEAALRAGVDYYDLQLSVRAKFEVLESLRERMERERRCFITDGGIHPGLSAAMIRALLPAFSRLERADCSGLMRVDWNAFAFSTSTIHELVDEFRDYRIEALRDGVWTRIPAREMQRKIDFGPPWGRQACSLMVLEELPRLAQSLPELRECGFYVSGFGPIVDYLVLPLGMAVLKVAPERLGPAYARLLARALKATSRPPYETVFQVEAEGVAAGPGVARRLARLRVAHKDGYYLTAAAAAACLLQYLDGSIRRPGLNLQGLVVEPGRFLTDLQKLGATVSVQGAPALAAR
jgi:saccharopine dehydrogenase (NAD+, L-lysine-forming)